MIAPSFNFKSKLAIYFGLLFAGTLFLLGIINWSISTSTAKDRVSQDLNRAFNFLTELSRAEEKQVFETVQTYAQSNPEVRAVLSVLSGPSSADLFGAETASDSDRDLSEAKNLLSATIPFLPIFEKYKFLSVLTKEGLTIYEKSSLPFLQSDLDAAGLLDVLRQAKSFWHSKDKIQHFVITPVKTGETVLGFIIVGDEITQQSLGIIKTSLQADIQFRQSDKTILSTLENNPDWLAISDNLFLGEDDKASFIAKKLTGLFSLNSQLDLFLIRSLTEELAPYRKSLGILFFISALSLLLTGWLILVLANAVSNPLRQLKSRALSIGKGQFEVVPIIQSGDEFQDLSDSFNQMVMGLQQREKIKTAFKHYVSSEVGESIFANIDDIKLGGESREITIYFADLAGFTSFSENESPEIVVQFLNEYFTMMTQFIEAEGGVIDKFIGDAVMAFWGAPTIMPDHSERCLRAAQNQIESLKEMAPIWQKKYKLKNLDMRIGVHTGTAIVGNIGSTQRMNFTVIGDSVNLASRLESLNKYYGTQLCVSNSTVQQTTNPGRWLKMDTVQVKGKQTFQDIFTLKESDKDYEFFIKGLEQYRAGDFTKAFELSEKFLEKYPEYQFAQLFADRCKALATNPPHHWQGVTEFKEK